MLDDDIADAAKRLFEICKRKNLTLATAESCTAGLIAGTLTEIPGTSSVLDRGFVTYSNKAKQAMLGVPAATLAEHGAVSRQTAEAMVRGVLANAPVDLAASVTGIAGPDGGSAEKPVGLVHFGAASRGGQFVHAEKRFGNPGRSEIRKLSVLQALRMLYELAEREPARPPRNE